MSEHDTPLPEDLRGALAASYGDTVPRDELRQRTLAGMHAEGLLAAPDSGAATKAGPARLLRWWAAAAAGLFLFVAGYQAGGAAAPAPAPDESTGGHYLLLLHEPPGGLVVPGATEPDLVAEYGAWARELAGEGRLLQGEKLAAARATVGDLVEGSGPSEITGFFVVRAGDLEAATALARTCPHARHGGTIEVRPIDPT